MAIIVVSDRTDPEGTAGAIILSKVLMDRSVVECELKLMCNFPSSNVLEFAECISFS